MLAFERSAVILHCMREHPGDVIHIEQLEIHACVGVPESERAKPQRLLVSITLWPTSDLNQLQDDLARTVNYSAVAKAVRQLVQSRRDKLIETLANAIAEHLLGGFAIQEARIELRKFVIPDSDHVAVVISRTRADFGLEG